MRFGIHIGPRLFKSKEYSISPELAEKLDVPRHPLEWLGELLAVAAIITNIVLLATQYQALPDLVPTHFGFSGQADGWNGRGTLLILLAVNIIMYLIMTVTANFPQLYNFAVTITAENAERQFLLLRGMLVGMKALVAWMLCYISYQSMAVGLGRASGMGWILWLLVGLMLLGVAITMALSYKWR